MVKLEVVTPERKVVNTEVDSVTVPTANGEVGILDSHAPLISALKPGILSYSVKGSVEKLVVSGGFVEVSSNVVSVLSDLAEAPDEIDLESAKADRETAEKALTVAAAEPIEANDRLIEQLETARARVSVASRF